MTEKVIAEFKPKPEPWYAIQYWSNYYQRWVDSRLIPATTDKKRALYWAENMANSSGLRTRVVER